MNDINHRLPEGFVTHLDAAESDSESREIHIRKAAVLLAQTLPPLPELAVDATTPVIAEDAERKKLRAYLEEVLDARNNHSQSRTLMAFIELLNDFDPSTERGKLVAYALTLALADYKNKYNKLLEKSIFGSEGNGARNWVLRTREVLDDALLSVHDWSQGTSTEDTRPKTVNKTPPTLGKLSGNQLGEYLKIDQQPTPTISGIRVPEKFVIRFIVESLHGQKEASDKARVLHVPHLLGYVDKTWTATHTAELTKHGVTREQITKILRNQAVVYVFCNVGLDVFSAHKLAKISPETFERANRSIGHAHGGSGRRQRPGSPSIYHGNPAREPKGQDPKTPPKPDQR